MCNNIAYIYSILPPRRALIRNSFIPASRPNVFGCSGMDSRALQLVSSFQLLPSIFSLSTRRNCQTWLFHRIERCNSLYLASRGNLVCRRQLPREMSSFFSYFPQEMSFYFLFCFPFFQGRNSFISGGNENVYSLEL